MATNTHGMESAGAKARDHVHPRRHSWKHAHKDWRVWIVVAVMLISMLIYVMTDNLSLRPGKRMTQPTPEAITP
jgi:hypothetical protein